MIISYLSHKKLNINGIGLKIIATGSPIAYRNLVQGFQDKNNLLICTDDQYDPIEIRQAFDFVGDPLLSKDVTNKYLPHIIKSYIENIDEASRNQIFSIFHKLESTLQDSLLLEDLPLEINFDEDLKKLLKMVGIHLDNQILMNPYAIIETVLKIYELCNLKTIPVMCNVANYLESQELIELAQIVKQMQLTLILIEFTAPDFLIVPETAEFYYIDKDLVDWY